MTNGETIFFLNQIYISELISKIVVSYKTNFLMATKQSYGGSEKVNKKVNKMKLRIKRNSMFRRVKKLTFLAVVVVTVLFAGNLSAQSHEKKDSEKWISPARTAVNMCPGGIAFGIFSANVEHLFSEHHGLVLRGDYEAIPKTYSDAEIDASGKAVILNYRYHIGGGLNSFYTGAFARYRNYKGEGILETGKFDFSIPECTVGLNVGKRWIWKSGFTLNFALGYGCAYDELKVNNSSQAAIDAIDVFRNDYAFMNGFLGEFSVGYAF